MTKSPTRIRPSDVESLEKEAARAGVNRLRQLFNAGNLQEAEALAAHAPQILAGRNLPRGSQIRRLGSGTEGVAQHVLMPGSASTPAGSAVVKTYDRTSPLYSPQVQQARAGMAGKQIPGHAQTYEFHRGPNTDHAINEFVPSVKGQRPTPAQIAETQAQVRHVVPGHELLDIGRQNMVRDARTGKATVIDSIPVPQQHTMPAHLRKGMPENVLNYHLDANSPTGQTMNAFKPNGPEWRQDQIYRQMSQNPATPRQALDATLAAKKDQTWAHADNLTSATERQVAGMNQQHRMAQRAHENELLRSAYGGTPQPGIAMPQGSQAPVPQQPDATRAARPGVLQQVPAPAPQPQPQQATVAARRPGPMRPSDLNDMATRR